MTSRIENLKEIVRYGTTLNVTVPTPILEGETFALNKYDVTREALKALEEDSGLNVVKELIEDDLTSINITIKPKE